MDAYNTKISTFGGKNKKNSDVGNFIAEKGAFHPNFQLVQRKRSSQNHSIIDSKGAEGRQVEAQLR